MSDVQETGTHTRTLPRAALALFMTALGVFAGNTLTVLIAFVAAGAYDGAVLEIVMSAAGVGAVSTPVTALTVFAVWRYGA